MIFFTAIGGSLIGKKWEKSAHYLSGAFAIINTILMLSLTANIMITFQLPDQDVQPSPYLLIYIFMSMMFGPMILIFFLHLPSHSKFVCRAIRDLPSFLYYSSALTQTILIHSYCNVDDVSWGTKGNNESHNASTYKL